MFDTFGVQAVSNALPECLEKSLWNKFTTFNSPASDEEFLLKLKRAAPATQWLVASCGVRCADGLNNLLF